MTKQYNKYLIGLTETFDSSRYPAVIAEIGLLNKMSSTYPDYFKEMIIISFLRDHSLQNNWIDANPELTGLMTSGTLETSHIEGLFDSCRVNSAFRRGLEEFLKENLQQTTG